MQFPTPRLCSLASCDKVRHCLVYCIRVKIGFIYGAYLILGVEIGFETSTYSVNEDAGAVTVCAALQSVLESGKSFAVTFRTVSGSEFGAYYLALILSQ